MAQKPQVTTVDPYADGFLMPEVVSTELKPKMREVDDGVKTEYEGELKGSRGEGDTLADGVCEKGQE